MIIIILGDKENWQMVVHLYMDLDTKWHVLHYFSHDGLRDHGSHVEDFQCHMWHEILWVFLFWREGWKVVWGYEQVLVWRISWNLIIMIWGIPSFSIKGGGDSTWHHDDNGTSTNKSTGRYGGKGMHSYIIKITHKRSLHRIIRYLREHRYRVGYPHYTWIHWLFTLRLYMITFLPVFNMRVTCTEAKELMGLMRTSTGIVNSASVPSSDAVFCPWPGEATHWECRQSLSLLTVFVELYHGTRVEILSGKPCMKSRATKWRWHREGWPASREHWEHRLQREPGMLLWTPLGREIHKSPRIYTRRWCCPKWRSVGSKWSSWWRVLFGSSLPTLH